MIIDKIKNASLYFGISKCIKKVLVYIQQTDFTKMELGNDEIENDNIYAMIFEYETKDTSKSFLAAHRNYIDVQYIVEGVE